jgi:hypothetical protein
VYGASARAKSKPRPAPRTPAPTVLMSSALLLRSELIRACAAAHLAHESQACCVAEYLVAAVICDVRLASRL